MAYSEKRSVVTSFDFNLVEDQNGKYLVSSDDLAIVSGQDEHSYINRLCIKLENAWKNSAPIINSDVFNEVREFFKNLQFTIFRGVNACNIFSFPNTGKIIETSQEIALDFDANVCVSLGFNSKSHINVYAKNMKIKTVDDKTRLELINHPTTKSVLGFKVDIYMDVVTSNRREKLNDKAFILESDDN